jgi:hypothetical protein
MVGLMCPLQVNIENVKTIMHLYAMWVFADIATLGVFGIVSLWDEFEGGLGTLVKEGIKGLIPVPLNFAFNLQTSPEIFVMQLMIFTFLLYWFFWIRKSRKKSP